MYITLKKFNYNNVQLIYYIPHTIIQINYVKTILQYFYVHS